MQFGKFTLIYSSLILLVASSLFSSFSANPPNGRTGAPQDGLCTDCHSPGNALGLQGELTIDGLPDQIVPGNTYSINILVRDLNGSAVKNGFQAVVLDGNNNNIGDIVVSSGNPTTQNANGREYVEHNPAKNFVNDQALWTFAWVAPEGMVGENVTMYVASIVANGANGNSNDLLLTNTRSGLITELTNTDDLASIHKIALFPNPASDYINIQLSNALREPVQVTILSASGQAVYQKQAVFANEATVTIPSSALSAGIYWVQLATSEAIYTERIVVIN